MTQRILGSPRARRAVLLGALAVTAGIATLPWTASRLPWIASRMRAQDDDPLSREAILRDPDVIPLTAPDGDITVVEYFDYQCPYCRQVYPDLMQVAKEDGKVRLLMKDWPVLGQDSVYAARISLAARYQDKYPQAHEALITASRRLTRTLTDERLAQAGIDVQRAAADLQTHKAAIDALLARNHQQARELGFRGTPGFIVGTFRVPGVLDGAGFRRAIADARAAAAKEKP